jgi:hypothetical protein
MGTGLLRVGVVVVCARAFRVHSSRPSTKVVKRKFVQVARENFANYRRPQNYEFPPTQIPAIFEVHIYSTHSGYWCESSSQILTRGDKWVYEIINLRHRTYTFLPRREQASPPRSIFMQPSIILILRAITKDDFGGLLLCVELYFCIIRIRMSCFADVEDDPAREY